MSSDETTPTPPSFDRAWRSQFVSALIELRPHLEGYGSTLTNTIASSEFIRHGKIDPRAAAQRYHATKPLERSAKAV